MTASHENLKPLANRQQKLIEDAQIQEGLWLLVAVLLASAFYLVVSFVDSSLWPKSIQMQLLFWTLTCLLLIGKAGGLFSSGLRGEILGMQTWQAKVVFVAYVALFISVTFSTKGIQGKGIEPGVLVLMSNIAKATISLALWRLQDGTFTEFIATTVRDRELVLKYSGLATLYVFSDVLRIDFIERTSPSSFHILVNLRAVFVVIVWERVMKRRLQLPQWVSVIVIASGCALKEWRHFNHGEIEDPLVIYAELFALFFIHSGATVYNEFLLKNSKSASTNFQNVALYMFGCVALVSMSLLSAHSPSLRIPTVLGNARALDPQQWWLVLTTPLALLQVSLLTILGLVTAHFLRLLSSVTKEVATGVEVICSVPLDAWIYGVAFGSFELVGSGLVVLGICIVARWPMTEAKHDTDEVFETTKLLNAEHKDSKEKLADP